MKNHVYRLFTLGLLVILAVAVVVSVRRIQDAQSETMDSEKISSKLSNIRQMDMGNGLTDEMVEDAEIDVEKVDGMSKNFIRGVDASEVIAQENSGVRYYDDEGKERDIFEIFSDNGINYIKVRIWNDPYDSHGNGYGGGNCDLDNAIKIGTRAARHSMKLMVNFQYSDFWADASRQLAPKAWITLDLEEKKKAIAEYTTDCLQKLEAAGAVIGMVQLGNETMSSFAGEKDNWENICVLLSAAADAVRQYAGDKEILIALNFTNPEDRGSFKKIAQILDSYQVDYDVFATTYYPVWNGSLRNLTRQLSSVATAYNKKVMVAETSYVYTLKDSDCYQNTIYDSGLLVPGYPATIQGQADMIRDIMQAVADVGENGIGICYADAAWISIGDSLEYNKIIWNRYGTGWASEYAASYDPDIAGMYGGSEVDNEAFFNANGKVLDSIKVFKYAYSGAKK